jgi:glycosyltransferase involved in cell wall biosynthesis
MRDALQEIGHSVVVVTTEHIERDGRVEIIPRPSRAQVLFEHTRNKDGSHPWVRAQVLNAFAAAKRAGIDVFEIEETHGWAGRLSGVPVVMRLHGPHRFVNEGHADVDRVRAEEAAATKVAAVTSPTQDLLDQLFMSTRIANSRVIPNPISLPQAQWQVENAKPDQVLFVGRIDHIKGADIALGAFTAGLQKRPHMQLLMVGPGEPVSAPPQVRFLGKLTPQEITELRLESSLYLSSSRFETFSYAIAEAMALGMPVLSTETMGGLALIQNFVSGRVINDLVGPMLEMLSNPAELSRIGTAARESVARQLDPISIAKETLALYRDVCVRT